MDEILQKLACRSSETDYVQVNADDLFEWSIGRGESVEHFLNRFGGEIARAYHKGELSFAFCDRLVNDLWGLLLQQKIDGSVTSWPETFYRVYDAFDAGEYHRRADRADNPIADFTNPAIAEIIATLPQQRTEKPSTASDY